ncbi:MAG: glycoside hydrolase family 43 protein [Mycobacteriales bacterium]
MTVVYAGDFPDPYVLRTGSSYLAFATETRGLDVQVMASPDLHSWTHLGNALAALPSWAQAGHTWSPAVLERPHGYVLYYATRLAVEGRQAISVAVADRPEGPYVDRSSAPLVYQRSRGGSIDPDPFVDEDGRAYLVWKSDDNAFGRRSSLWVRELTADGLGFSGRPVRVLKHALAWEQPLVEAPCLVRVGSQVHLLYSAGQWESRAYGVGHAVGTRPTGPFRVTTQEGPWLSGTYGPGGQSVVEDVSGGLQLAYHGWLDGLVGYARGGVRALHVDPLDLAGGVPRLG